MKKAFAPEFINRIDDIVVFNSLAKEHINKIIDIVLKELYARIDELGFKLKLGDTAKDYIADKGFDANFGARPLKRALQKYIEDPLAEEIVKSNLAEGDTIELAYDKDSDSIKIKITKGKKKKTPKPKEGAEDKTDSNGKGDT